MKHLRNNWTQLKSSFPNRPKSIFAKIELVIWNTWLNIGLHVYQTLGSKAALFNTKLPFQYYIFFQSGTKSILLLFPNRPKSNAHALTIVIYTVA